MDDSTPQSGSSSDPRPAIMVTHPDMERLRSLVDSVTSNDFVERLEAELDRASVVPVEDLPPGVVTMRSRVVFEDAETGKRREAELCYPHEADAANGRISILAPVGMALLGLSVGDAIRWPLPSGRAATLRVISVPYQPEAAGHLHR